MTNVIRCDCGFVAREATAEEAKREAELHLLQSHPDLELNFSDACQPIEEQNPYPDELRLPPMGSGISGDYVEAAFLY